MNLDQFRVADDFAVFKNCVSLKLDTACQICREIKGVRSPTFIQFD